ncbi:hypothetical protein [Devosia sp.]|uniref:hypothetical protein n=1 Tax=Devosia sp. TaxID=1871048 RepID=UPI002B0031FF|nr:hypothetical protein [Devosia sp.]
MKPLISRAALIVPIALLAFGAPAQAQPLPSLLDFFSMAEPTERTPRIDNYDETWMITGPVSQFSARATEGPRRASCACSAPAIPSAT